MSTEALSLYRSSGWVEVPRFNDEPFADHWFEKRLVSALLRSLLPDPDGVWNWSQGRRPARFGRTSTRAGARSVRWGIHSAKETRSPRIGCTRYGPLQRLDVGPKGGGERRRCRSALTDDREQSPGVKILS